MSSCALVRPLLDRLLPEPRSAADELGRFATRLATGANGGAGAVRGAARVALIGVSVLVIGVGIVAAGTPARGIVAPDTAEVLDRLPRQIDPATLPAISVEQEVADLDNEIAGPGMQAVVLALAENLELEEQALLRKDASILVAVDHGDRLIEMQGRLDQAIATGTTVIDRYQIDALDVSLLVPFGKQTGLSLGFAARGTVTDETYDAAGAVQGRETAPFAQTFVMRRATGARWLNVAVLPPGSEG